MPQEFEAKFLDIDINKIKKKLAEIGAKMVHPMKKYVRSVYFMCDRNIKGYVRIRDEGGKVYLTAKKYSKSAKFPEEFELSINQDFNRAMDFFDAIGLVKKAFHESYREKWEHSLAHEITFDTVPGLPTYMEIDCDSKEKLNNLIDLLNLDKSKMRFGAYDKTYNEYYGIPTEVINDQTPFLTFKNIINEIKPTKNKDLLAKIASKQKELGISLADLTLENPTLVKKLNKINNNNNNNNNNISRISTHNRIHYNNPKKHSATKNKKKYKIY